MGNANTVIPVTEPAMPRKKGAKCVPPELCKTIYDMYSVGVHAGTIAKYYTMNRPIVSSIVRRLRINKTKKRMGRPLKLSKRGMRVLKEVCIRILPRTFVCSHDSLLSSYKTISKYVNCLKIDKEDENESIHCCSKAVFK